MRIRIYAEWVDYMDAYRLYAPEKPGSTIAYVPDLTGIDYDMYAVTIYEEA